MSQKLGASRIAQLGWFSRLTRTIVYWITCAVAIFTTIVLFRMRAYGRERTPMTGKLLMVANHQSYLDPPCIGGYSRRRLSCVAQSGLYKFKPLAWLLEMVGCIAINQETGDAGAIREVLRRLDEGAAVLIFPEGSRCEFGEMEEFKRGVTLLVKKAKCPVQPAAIHGAFEAWPRQRKLPRVFGPKVAVLYGEPISYDELMKDGADAAMQRLKAEIEKLRQELMVRMSGGRSTGA